MPRSTNTRAAERVVNESLNSIPEKQSRILNEHIKSLKEENSELAKEIKALKEQLSLETQIKDVRKSSLDESSEALKKQQDTIENIRDQRNALIFQMEKELQLGKITNEEYEKGMELVYELDDLEKSHLETRNELLGTYGKEQRAQAIIILNESKKNKELEDSKKFVEDRIKALEKENETLDKNSAKYKENVDAINAAKGQLNSFNRPSIYDFAGKDYFSTATKAVFGGGFLGATGAFIDSLMPNEDKAKENKEKSDKQLINFAKELKKIGKNVEDIEDTEKDEAKQAKEKGGSFGDLLGKFSGFFKNSGVDADDVDDIAGAGAAGAVGKLGGVKAGVAGLAADVLVDKLDDLGKAVRQMTSALNSYVDEGARFLATNKGAINAALYGMEGTADRFSEFFDRANDVAGTTLFKLDDYLSEIRTLTSSGIGQGVEVAALLTTVADKTVPKFNATNAYLRRLVLLGEKDATQRFFGLESIIQKSLNEQFGESSYLNQLFDSVNANLQDAIANLGTKLGGDVQYEFLSTAQSWLGNLYEQGVDSQTITRISNVLNAIGSGNIAAMSSDAGMQKIALLAMDAAGLDYASIMQGGLTVNNTNLLMNSMVNYLKEIATKTNENNVLESAYANLFGMSMTDMYAFRNYQDYNLAVANEATINKEVNTRLYNLGDDAYTTISEKIDNLVSNIQFDFGTRVADNTADYIAFKGGQVAYDIGEAIEQMPVVGAAGKLIKGAGAVSMFASTIVPMIGVVKDLAATVGDSIANNEKKDKNTVEKLYDIVSYKSESNTGSTSSTSTSTSSKKSEKFKTFYLDEETDEYTKFKKDSKIKDEMVEEEFDKEDPILEILKELEKTFMKNDNQNMAIAVSLQGMSNEVLKSFASIFADEESMSDVFSDKNKKAKNKLFDYDFEDSSSSENKSKTKGKRNTTTDSKAPKRANTV